MIQFVENLRFLVTHGFRFLLLPIILFLTFNLHRSFSPELAPHVYHIGVFSSIAYATYLIIYLLKGEKFREYIGIRLILIVGNLLTIKMLINQFFHLFNVNNQFFTNLAETSVDTWISWFVFGSASIYAVAQTHKWRSDRIKSDSYDPQIVMFAAKVPKTYWAFWWAVLKGDPVNAYMGMVGGKVGRFSAKESKFIYESLNPARLNAYVLKKAEHVDYYEFVKYIYDRNGEKTDPIKNKCYEWGKYNPSALFRSATAA